MKGKTISPPDRPGPAPAEALPRLGFVLLAAVSLFWGLNWPAMKIVLSQIPPWTFRTLCLLLGGSGLLGLAKLNGLSLSVPPGERRPLLWLTLFNITGWHLASAYGVMRMPAGRAVIVAFTMPLWASILGRFLLSERLTSRRLLGLACGLAGLACLIGPDVWTLGAAPVGAAFMLTASVSWALGTVLFKYFRFTLPLTVLTGWQMILGGLPVVAGALILEPLGALGRFNWTGLLAMVYILGLPMLFCHWAWLRIVQLFPAGLASVGTLAIPVIGVFSSAWLLGEPVGLLEISALILVVLALAIVLLDPGALRPRPGRR